MLVRIMIIFYSKGSFICCRMYKIEEFVHPGGTYIIFILLLYKYLIIIR